MLKAIGITLRFNSDGTVSAWKTTKTAKGENYASIRHESSMGGRRKCNSILRNTNRTEGDENSQMAKD